MSDVAVDKGPSGSHHLFSSAYPCRRRVDSPADVQTSSAVSVSRDVSARLISVSCANDLFAQSSSCPACQQELAEPSVLRSSPRELADYSGDIVVRIVMCTQRVAQAECRALCCTRATTTKGCVSDTSERTASCQTVLAGLPPATIMEIAQRAISFWTYQMSQQRSAILVTWDSY